MKKPDFSPQIMELEAGYVKKLLDLDLDLEEIKNLLEKMRFGVEKKEGKLRVKVPPYRTDILHPIDLVEDVAIAYGYEKFEPEIPNLATVGQLDEEEKFYSRIREYMIGFGFQEVMTLIMSNEEKLYDRMNLEREKVVETKNPVSEKHSVARSWLLPSLMSILEVNKNREYPQMIFETGQCIYGNGKDYMALSAVSAHSEADFAEAKALATGLLTNVGFKEEEIEFQAREMGCFIKGRCGANELGFFGELHPQVLENFKLEMPAVAFEFDLEKIISTIK